MNVLKRLEANVPLMAMLIGLPGSGKSTLAESMTTSGDNEEYKPVIHSSDGLRKELFGDEATQGDNNKLFTELHRRIKADLIAGKDVIYDATNISKKLRIQFLNELKNISCTPICLCMMTSYETCLKNNEKRDRKVTAFRKVRTQKLQWILLCIQCATHSRFRRQWLHAHSLYRMYSYSRLHLSLFHNSHRLLHRYSLSHSRNL